MNETNAMNTEQTIITAACLVNDKLADLAEFAVQMLRASYPRAKERRIDASTALAAIARHTAACAQYPGEKVATRAHGGAVANAYRGKADADWLVITTNAEGYTSWVATRDWARKAPYGNVSDHVITRVILPGMTDGRIFKAA
jgi:hypothetical protein